MTYDLVLRGGRVIDPAQGLDGPLDVGVSGGRIAAVARTLPPGEAREVVDVRDQLVLPGLIDTHAHVYQYVTGRFGLPADLVGVHSATTTVVDQGGPSCMTLPGFRKFVVGAGGDPRSTRSSPRTWSAASRGTTTRPSTAPTASTSARPSARRGRTPIWSAASRATPRSAASPAGVSRSSASRRRSRARPTCPSTSTSASSGRSPRTGAGGADPDAILPEVVELLRPGDVLAHPFTRHPGGLRRPPRPRAPGRQGGDVARLAHRRRPRLPLQLRRGAPGAGRGDRARHPRAPTSTATTPACRGRPEHRRATTRTPSSIPSPGARTSASRSAMTGLMACGLRLEQVVPMVTRNAARLLARDERAGHSPPGRRRRRDGARRPARPLPPP